METPQKRRGLISHTVMRLIQASLLLAVLLVPQLASAAPPASLSGVSSVDSAKEFFRVSGDNLLDNQYQAVPQSISGPDGVNPKQLAIVICAQTGSGGNGQCTSRSADAYTFKFTQMHHEDRGGDLDYWDYSFVAAGNNTLRFLYRKNPSQGSHWGLVYGDTDQDPKFSENFIVGLENLSDTDLVRNILEPQADDAGLAWAKRGGIKTSVNQTDLLDRATTEPFLQATQKAAEAINSLNETVSGALLWAIQASNPNEAKGLSEAWQTVRDLVNILFMLILVTIAIMTILRLDAQKYNVRSLLPTLIFAIVTVNFSFIVATVLVNTAYVLSQPFLEGARDIVTTAGQRGGGFSNGPVDFGTAIVMLLASLLLLVALAILLFFFVIRIIVIWLLSALSPVVCLFMVLPLTRGESKKIFGNGIKWIYMAPISLLILYIGSQVAFPTFGQSDTVDAFLSALFYGGLIIAAVIIPIGLGGRVMSMAASRGSKAAKLGGKGGLGAASLLPAGGGRTVGQRVREGKAFVEQRKANLERRAGLSAANAQLGLADGPLGSAITGMDDGIRVSMQDKMLADKEKELLPYNVSAKRRIAHAWQYGTDSDAGGTYALDQHGQRAHKGHMSASELSLSRDRIAAGAAYKSLAQSDLSELYMVDQPGIRGRTFNWTGGQQLHKGDPVIGSYDLSGRLNEESMRIKSAHLDADGVKGLDTTFLDRARGGDRLALDSLREIDEVRLGNAVDAENRFKFSNAAKMRTVYDVADQGLLSQGLTGTDLQEQLHKEEIIKKSYERGQRYLER